MDVNEDAETDAETDETAETGEKKKKDDKTPVFDPRKHLVNDFGPRANFDPAVFQPLAFRYYANLYVTLGMKVVPPTPKRPGFTFPAVSFTRVSAKGKPFNGLDIHISALDPLIKTLLVIQENVIQLKDQQIL